MSHTHATVEVEDDRESRAEAWPAVWSLALGVFGLVTAEFLPASLLTPMAADLAVSNGMAGQAVTATAVVAAVAGPVIVVGTSALDRRRVMWGLTGLLVVSNILAATASGLPMLLFSRVLLGVSLGGFWSMAAALALRLVRPAQMAKAMSIVFTGVSLATVCAAPVGAWIGDKFGWRAAFVVAGVLALTALVVQLATIPRLPPADRATFATFGLVLRRPRVFAGLAIVLLAVSGHFSAFTYVRPFLEQVPVLRVEAISLALLAFGVGGFFGNLAGGYLAGKNERRAVVASAALIAASTLAMALLGSLPAAAMVATGLWGFAFGAFPVGVQTWVTKAAADHAESAGGLLLVAFQIAIASGALLGGLMVDEVGPRGPLLYAFVTAALGAGLAALQPAGRAS
jgi:DHA1 family purine ribonucleoside efflux pump-like MFS transporter